ncbi:MAG: S8 family serine peptidase [Chloroflexi bacterium]|nr:S8 family serine peptidase [Chloroflexota bacterium]
MLLFVSMLLAVVLASPSTAAPQKVKIDPRVLQDTTSDQIADFLVVLKSQANARAAALRAPDHRARAPAVFASLRQAADSAQPAIRAQLDALGVEYRAYWIANLIAVRGNRAAVDALAARGDVAAIESDRAFRVELPKPENLRVSTGVAWNVSQVNAPALWASGYTGQGIVYANGDTGVQWDHPALKPHYRGWNGAAADHNYNWWDAVHTNLNSSTNPCNPSAEYITLPGSGSIAPCDDGFHGTHTMGIGVGDDGAGNQVGVAPGAKWIACRNMDYGVGRPSMYIECMQFFLAPTDLAGDNPDPSKHADVVGNSYGCPPSELCAPDSLRLAMENMRAAGIFMAVSAGNSGSGCETVNDPPALDDSAITVGATASSDVIASFSSRGPVTVDGSNRRKPDLTAPGVSIQSSVPLANPYCPGNTYCPISGTSMASPHVAGGVALLWSAFPGLRGNVDQTEFLLQQSAVHLTTAQGCGGDTPTQVPNNVYGYGRIDLLAAYNLEWALLAPFKYYFPIISKSP